MIVTGGWISRVRPWHFRGKALLCHSMRKQSGIRHWSVYGCEFSLDLLDYVQRSTYCGTFEPKEWQEFAPSWDDLR
jgi:hypothetical protein